MNRMKKMNLSELFEVKYGTSLDLASMKKNPRGINFVSRTSKNNGVCSKVSLVNNIAPIRAGTISVAVSGSVLESFYQPSDYYTGFHVLVLTPIIEMSIPVMLYYCHCIRMNKYKYSFGRQANATLRDLSVPSQQEIPEWVHSCNISSLSASLLQNSIDRNCDFKRVPCSRLVKLDILFTPKNGLPSSKFRVSKQRDSEYCLPFIRPSFRQATSIAGYLNSKDVSPDMIYPQDTLYVSTNGQGSHTFSYVSVNSFVPNSDVMVLLPKKPMCTLEKLYYSMCITSNRYKYSYGRKPKGKRLMELLVPEYCPDWLESDIISNITSAWANASFN